MIEPFNIGGKMNNTDILLEQSRCISHEIRNHLSICELYSQIIRKNLENEGINNESIDNALNCIGKSIKIMGNSLLDLKSLNNFSYTYCNIKDIVEEGVKLSEVYTHGKTIDITTSFNGSAKVYIDENKFLACIVNIIKNAIEAIVSEGKIKVSLDVGKSEAHIKIANNGEMISKERQTAIFEEGFTTKNTGCGLGLHICMNNLKVQNALLRLNKSTSEITEFEIIVPIAS